MDGNLVWSCRGVVQATNYRGLREFGLKTLNKLRSLSVVRMATTVVGPTAGHGFWRTSDPLPVPRGEGFELSLQVFKKSTRICGRRAIYCRRLLPTA